MKRILTLAAVILLALTGCKQEKAPLTATKPKQLADPEIAIEGVPSDPVESGTPFTVKVTSKSEGEITLSVDKPSVAIIKPTGDLEYSITAMSADDDKVKITASQEEKGDYKAATKSVSFKVIGLGSASLPGPNDKVEGTGVEFIEKDGEAVSPERGMYSTFYLYSDSQPLTADDVAYKRQSGNTLWLVECYLTKFMDGTISNAYLDMVQKTFDAIRGGGAKAIVRFAYRDTDAGYPSTEMDPEVAVVLQHVGQLKPILIKNEDVIFCLQAGFVGAWGEWYYTTHFGFSPSTVEGHKSRKELTDALLDALPASRQIQLRTPKFKMMMYGLSVTDSLTAATAHDGSIYSRLAGHNDCFGASKDDQGTFDGEDTRKFWKTETRYTIMGGETCAVSDYCLCPATLKDLEDYHWTYLHDGYHQDVLSRWSKDGCMDEIRSRLGYRLVLKDVHYGAVKAGEPCKVTIRLDNKGFAAPMNPREAWLVWVGSDGKASKSLLGADPRTWHRGYNAVVSVFTPTTDKGTLYLELSDPLLADNPAYSIVLANKDIFDTKTGYNKLFEVK